MTERNSKIKVLLADDHAVVRKGLVQIISETVDIQVMGEAEDGAVLLDRTRELHPDVVLMDINMPGKSGWDVMTQLKAESPQLPVIVLSISPEEDYAIKFFKAGASGYLTKASAPEQLIEAIRKVAAGGKFVSPSLAEKLAFAIEDRSEQKPHEALSPREFQIFCLIASGKTVSQIARELSLSVATISTHRTRLLEKMDMKNNAQLTHYAFKNNILEDPLAR